MIISPLRQALCSDRSQVTEDPGSGRWLAADMLPAGWAVYSFHFFVDWQHEPPVVGDTFLLTYLVDLQADEELLSVSEENVLKAFTEADLHIEFESLRRVCANYGKKLVSVLLPECEISELNEGTPFWIVSCGKDRQPDVAKSTISGLKKSIRKHSGGPVRVGKKGLTFGTSAIECFLSLTDAAYPGDADAVVVDGNGHVRYVIEFKKHTVATPLGEHLANRYYPEPDGRKYQRLHRLVSLFGLSDHDAASLVIFYHSTRSPLIRLQLIGELNKKHMEIVRDSKDVCIGGMNDREVADKVIAWLGIWE